MANTFSFDDSEFSEGKEGDAADAAIADLEESPAPVEELEDTELSDVDLRLETADYYRAILRHEFFDTESNASQIVDREIRTFIRERLEVLLGLRTANQPSVVVEAPFDDEEVQALKLLASKVLKRPGIVSEPPAVKKMATPAPVAKPQVQAQVKAKPQAKKIPAPAPGPSSKPKAKPAPAAKPTAAKAPTPAPVQKAEAPKKNAAPSQEAKVVDRTIENGESQTFVGLDGKQVTLTEGEVIEEGGRRYMVSRNGAGTLYRRDITGQVAPPNRLPAMSVQQMSIMSQQWAEQQINSQDDLGGLAIVASLQQK